MTGGGKMYLGWVLGAAIFIISAVVLEIHFYGQNGPWAVIIPVDICAGIVGVTCGITIAYLGDK
jgi:hypothetical protein